MHAKVGTAMSAVRAACDKLEVMVDGTLWPMPRYAELMWYRLAAL